MGPFDHDRILCELRAFFDAPLVDGEAIQWDLCRHNVPEFMFERRGDVITVNSRERHYEDVRVSSFEAMVCEVPKTLVTDYVEIMHETRLIDEPDVVSKHILRQAFWSQSMAEFVAKTWAPRRMFDWCLDEDDKRELAGDFRDSDTLVL